MGVLGRTGDVHGLRSSAESDPLRHARRGARGRLRRCAAAEARPAQVGVDPAPASPPSQRDEARSIYTSALNFFDQRDYLRCEHECRRALLADPSYYLAWHKIGLCHYERREYAEEIAAYTRCLEINPDFEEARLNLGHAYVGQDRLEDAIREYGKVLEKNDTHKVALFNSGLVYFDLSKFDLSQKLLNRFIELYPQDQLAPKAMRHLERAKGQLEAARQHGGQ